MTSSSIENNYFDIRIVFTVLSRFLLFVLLLKITNVSSYNCSKGCDLNEQVSRKLVCGVDNITYMNRCLAECQGVNVIGKPGACDDDSTFNESQIDFSVFITKDIIDKYKSQGFKFIVKWNTSTFQGRSDKTEPVSNFTSPPNTSLANKEYQARRLTREGYEYASNITNITLPYNKSQFYNGFKPAAISYSSNRKLSVIGTDTRTRINPTTQYAYSVVVSINYGDSVAYCSGTVIAPDAVVTAGHCVYKPGRGWLGHDTISPALNLLGNEPYGRWNVSDITTYSQWMNGGSADYDLAVVRYLPNGDGNKVGDVVGYAGIAAIEDVASDTNLQASTITGYPEDYPYEMWTSNQCPGMTTQFWYLYKIYYDCDTAAGMSGSGIVGPDYKIRGVHTTGGTRNSGTGFFANSPHYGNVLVWSGVDASFVVQNTCACRWWQFLCRLRYRCVIKR